MSKKLYPCGEELNIPQKIYVVEAMRPDRDDWFPSRVFTDIEEAIRCSLTHEGRGNPPWVFRVVEFSRVGEIEFQVKDHEPKKVK